MGCYIESVRFNYKHLPSLHITQCPTHISLVTDINAVWRLVRLSLPGHYSVVTVTLCLVLTGMGGYIHSL